MKKLALAFLFVICTSSLFCQTFHVLLIGDLHDQKIGFAVKRSVQNYERSFSYLCKVSKTDLKLKKLVLSESKLAYCNILRWIHHAKVSPKDVLVVIYN